MNIESVAEPARCLPLFGHHPSGKRHRVSTLYNASAACEGLRPEACGWPVFYLHIYRMTRSALLQALSA